MVDERVSLIYDADSAIIQAKKVFYAITGLNKSFLDQIQYTVRLNETLKGPKYQYVSMTAALKDGTTMLLKNIDANKEASTVYQNASVTAQKSALARKKAAEETAKAEEKLHAANKARYAELDQLFKPQTLNFASVDLDKKLNFQKAIEKIQRFVQKNQISVDEVRNIWTNLDAGFEPQTGIYGVLEGQLAALNKYGKAMEASVATVRRSADEEKKIQEKKRTDIQNILSRGIDFKSVDVGKAIDFQTAVEKTKDFVVKEGISIEEFERMWQNTDKKLATTPETGLNAKLQRRLMLVKKHVSAMQSEQDKLDKQTESVQLGAFLETNIPEKIDLDKSLNLKANILKVRKFAEDNNISAQRVKAIWTDLSTGLKTVKLNGAEIAMAKMLSTLRTNVDKVKSEGERLKKATAFGDILRGQIVPGSLDLVKELRLKENISAIEKFVYKNDIAADRLQAIWASVKSGKGVASATAAENTLQRQLASLDRSMVAIGATSTKAEKKMKAMFLSWQSIARLSVIQVLHRSISSATTAMRSFVSEAIQMQIKIAEIQTIDASKLPFNEWNDQLHELSSNWGVDLIDQANAAYETLSNQVAEGAEAFGFLNDANRFAITTASSSADSVNLLSSAINAFKLSVNDTSTIAASFFKTIDLGRVRSSEMAETYGQIAVPAQMLGITMNELNAAISVTTRQGIKYNNAQTLLRNIMLKLIRPTDNMKQLFRDIGVTSGEAAIQTYGFSKMLALLEERTQGSSAEIGELFNTIRATVGAMIFSGKNLQQYNSDLLEITNSTEAYGKAVDIVMESSGKKVQVLGNKIKNFFVNNIGNAATDSIAYFIELYEEAKKIDSQLDFDKMLQKNKAASKKVEVLTNATLTNLQKDLDKYQLTNQITLNKIEDSFVDTFKHVYDYVDQSLNKSLSTMNSFNDKLRETVNNFPKELKNMKFEYSTNIFDFKIKDLDLEDKLKAISKRMQDFANKNKKLTFLAGTDEQFEENQKEIFRLFGQRQQLMESADAQEIKGLKIKYDYQKEYTKLINTEITDRKRLAATNIRATSTIARSILEFNNAVKKIKEFSERDLKDESAQTQIAVYKQQISTIDRLLGMKQKLNISTTTEQELAASRRLFENKVNITAQQIELQKQKQATALARTQSQVSAQRINDLEQERQATLTIVQTLEQVLETATTAEGIISILSDKDVNPFAGGLMPKVTDTQTAALVRLKEALSTLKAEPDDIKSINNVSESIKSLVKSLPREGLTPEFKNTYDEIIKLESVLTKGQYKTLPVIDWLQIQVKAFNDEANKLGDTYTGLFKFIEDANAQKFTTIDLPGITNEQKDKLNNYFLAVKEFSVDSTSVANAKTLSSAIDNLQKAFKGIQAPPDLGNWLTQAQGIQKYLSIGGPDKVPYIEWLNKHTIDINKVQGKLKDDFNKTITMISESIQKLELASISGYVDLKIPNIDEQQKKALSDYLDMLKAFKIQPMSVTNADALSVSIQNLRDRFTNIPTDSGMSALLAQAEAVNKVLVVGEGTKSFIQQTKEIQALKTKYAELQEAIYAGTEAEILKSREMASQLTSLNNQIAAQQIYLDKQREMIENMRTMQRIQLVGQASGVSPRTVTTRASGGSIRGTDVIPAMLSPGEFVVNAKTAGKFYSQFVSMNSRGYERGGSVSNSFGPMHFEINSSGNEQLDAIKIAKAIKREIRRGTVSRWDS